MTPERNDSNRVSCTHIVLVTALITGVSILLARINVLLAYAILESLAIVAALFIYVFSSRTRKYTRDDYLLLLGYGSLTVAILDFFSLITYPGSAFFAGATTNASSQFWIAARYIHAFSLFIAPFAAAKRFRAKIVFPAYLFAAGMVIASIFKFKTFPLCYIEGSGFTPVKIYSEYFICVILVGAIWFTWDFRQQVGNAVVSLVLPSMFMLIACELFSTLHPDINSLPALLAHVCKGMAMYLIFHGTVAEGLNRPFQEMSRAREKLGERLQFESLLNDLSAELAVQLSLKDISESVKASLVRLADFFSANQAAFLETDGQEVAILASINRDSLHGPGSSPFPPLYRWLAIHFKQGKNLVTEDILSILPDNEESGRAIYTTENINSCAYVTCYSSSGKIAGVCLLARNPISGWDEELIPRLRLAGELFANALHRGLAGQETRQLRDELNHVSRVSTMGHLTAALAHEIKQPLTAILSNAQVGLRYLAEPVPDKKELADIFQDIVGDDRRASDIIGNIRNMMKREKSKRSPVRLTALTGDLLNMLGDVLSETRVLLEDDLTREKKDLLVSVDSTQIQQVILNLIMNAVDAMQDVPPGKRIIRLSISRCSVEPAAVKLTVSDVGMGISPDCEKRIFSPFVSTKKDGLGMGLTICRGIIEDHGGKLWIEETTANGTSVSFSIPQKTVCFSNSLR